VPEYSGDDTGPIALFNLQTRDIGWYLTLMIGSTIAATWFVYWWVKKTRLDPTKDGIKTV